LSVVRASHILASYNLPFKTALGITYSMKIFLAFIILIPILFLGSAIYQERCMQPISSSLKAFYDIKSLTAVVNDFKVKEGYLPESLGDLGPKYIRKVPAEPWGNEYIYKTEGSKFKVYSLGSDSALGGIGAAEDRYVNDEIDGIINSIYQPVWGCNA
jgi:hypothetical protein